MKRSILVVLIISLCTALLAQESYISTEPCPNKNYNYDLSGNSGILVLSKNSNLVFNIPNVLSFELTSKGTDKNGDNQYLIIIDENETKQPKVEVSRRGDVYKTSFLARLQPNKVLVFRINEVENPIRIDDQTNIGDIRLNAEETELEISSTIKDLDVNCNPALNAKITKGTFSADKSVNVINVVIPVKNLTNARDKYEQVMNEYEVLKAKVIDDDSYMATEQELARYDQLEIDITQSAQDLAEIQTVYISSSGSNRVAIDISDLGPRIKKNFVVLPLKIEVPSSECSERMREAAKRFEEMKYKDALNLYETALKSDGCTNELSNIINNQYIKECNTCIVYDLQLKKALKRVQELKNQGTASQNEAIKVFDEAYKTAELLYNYTSNKSYLPILDKFKEIMNSIPINISITCVEWLKSTGSFSEGGVIPNVQIYADYGNSKENIPRKSKKFIQKYADNSRYKLLGETNNSGNLIIKLPRENQPTALVICPMNNDFRVEYKNIETILSQSKGSYLERQFRLKLLKE